MRGEPAGPRCDQFAFCVSVYEALYGERPYDDGSMDALIDAMTHERVRPAPEGSPVPERVRQALLRGLAAEPERRWPSMEPLLYELQQAAAPWRPRLRLMGIGALAAAGLVAILALVTMDRGSPEAVAEVGCEGAEAPLHGVWDDGRKQQVSRAILDTRQPFALDTWERVERGLDGYAAGWTSRHGALCDALEGQGRLSAEARGRWACLRGRLDALRTTVDWLAEADEATVQGAVEVMDQSLPPIAGCDEAGEAGADERGGPAAVHRDEAASLSRRGVVLRKQGQLAEALDHHERALAIRQRTLDPHSVGVARTLTNIGIVLTAQGKLAEALARHREALAIREEVLGPLHPHVAGSLTNIGLVLARQGKP
ncbi:MAG: tetratricopeptide repeat protein, partial [Myxococcales bacterium]|nr:tetratricopeptide repeat protein [Myxococcales bacterium]